MKKYLVTGSAGFIGFYVAKALLDRGDEVIGIDNMNPYYSVTLKEDRNDILKKYPNYTFHYLDLVEREKLFDILKKEKPKVICHLAAQAGVRYSLENPYVYEQSNLLGTLNLLEWSKKSVKNFVFASSSSVYGGNRKIPFSESDRVDNPISLYAATKKGTELMAHAYHHLFKTPMTGLRFFTVYGPWGRPDMALYTFARNMVQKEPIEVYGYGKMLRDFTFIEDMVPAVLNCLDTPRGYEIYNLGGNSPVKLMDFISFIEKELGVTAEKMFLPMQPGDVRETYANIDKARRDLGFEPKTSVKNGVKRSIAWFKKYYSD